MIVPWRDQRGRFLRLKAAALAAAFIPGAVLTSWWLRDMLGAKPITELIHGTGDWAIRSLFISLALTPASRVLQWPRLCMVRRIVGVTALAYALAHLTLYAVDQNFRLGFVVLEIAMRFYLTIGLVVLLGLAALGCTSTNDSMRWLGCWWKRLHRMIYVLAAIALLHYFIQSKSNISEPAFFSGLLAWLLLWRALPMPWQCRLAAQLALTVVAAGATAGIEFAWYALATGINPWRVLAASETLRFGLRPAHCVALVGLAVTLLSGLRRLIHLMGPRLRLAPSRP